MGVGGVGGHKMRGKLDKRESQKEARGGDGEEAERERDSSATKKEGRQGGMRRQGHSALVGHLSRWASGLQHYKLQSPSHSDSEK